MLALPPIPNYTRRRSRSRSMHSDSKRSVTPNISALTSPKKTIPKRAKEKKIKTPRSVKGGKEPLHKRRTKKPLSIIGMMTKGDIRRLARRGGVKRISGTIYKSVNDCLTDFVKGVIKDANIIANEVSGRQTIMARDIVYALKRRGKHLYGFV